MIFIYFYLSSLFNTHAPYNNKKVLMNKRKLNNTYTFSINFFFMPTSTNKYHKLGKRF